MARKKTAAAEKQDPTGKRLICYIRVSDTTGREDTMVSPQIQENACRRWAETNGATIVDVLSDLNKTGTESTKRQIGDIIDMVADKKADGVVVYMVDRWGRDHLDAGMNIKALQNVGGVFFSASEDLSQIHTPEGTFTLTMLLGMAEMASKQIGKRWKQLHILRLEEHGRPPAGGSRFGYRYIRSEGRNHWGRYEKDDVTGPVLRECYLKYSGGASISNLIDWLREKNVTTTRGTQFSKNALYVALDSGFGAGLIVVNTSDTTWGVDRVYKRGSHEAVISEAEWEQYKARRQRKEAPRTKGAPYRLSGLVYCSGCKKRTYRSHATQKRKDGDFNLAFLSCHLKAKHRARVTCPTPARMAMHKIDEAVYAWMQQWASDDKRAEREMAARMKTQVIVTDIKKLERSLKAAQDNLVKLAEDTRAGMVIASAGKLMQERAEAQITALEKQLESARHEERINTSPPLVQFDSLLAAWDALDANLVNERLRGFIQAVYIHPVGAEQRVEVFGTWEEDPHATQRETWGSPVLVAS